MREVEKELLARDNRWERSKTATRRGKVMTSLTGKHGLKMNSGDEDGRKTTPSAVDDDDEDTRLLVECTESVGQ